MGSRWRTDRRCRAPPKRSGGRIARRGRRVRQHGLPPSTTVRRGEASARSTPSADRALHLEFYEAVHLDRVLHRQLLDDRLDEAVDDELAGLLLVDPVGLEVEELLLADLGDRGLVADVDLVLADADR